MSPLRLAPAAARALAAKAGVSLPDPPKRKTRTERPELARGLDTQCRALGIPIGRSEYAFHPTRKWRSDRAWPEQKLLVEVDGGAWLEGGGHSHSRGSQFERDRKKDAEALLLGFRTLRLTPKMLKSGEGVFYIAQLLGYPTTRRTGRRDPRS
jgi:hypothetical protein